MEALESKDGNTMVAFCDCSHESLVLRWDEEYQEMDVSIYEFAGTPTWRHKLRHIWRIIRHGTPYGDQVCLSTESVITVAHYMSKKVENDIQEL